ncbi:MAG TPA: glycosyltransferase family 2 protein [bacterium]|nr:glycosyltransferase family 2 protein [bacterium]
MTDAAPRVSVTVVIPVLNEEANLPLVLRELPDFIDEVIVVDGLSRDRSVETALRVRPDCRVMLETRKGKGVAVTAGLAGARGEYVLYLDGDYSHDPWETTRMVECLAQGYDVVHGSRFLPGGGSADLTTFRFLGNRIVVWLTNLLHGTRYTDVCYGYFGFRREAVRRLAVRAENMEIDAALMIGAHKAGLRVIELPSFERRRFAGRSTLHPLRDGWKIIREILRTRFRE